MIARTLYVYQSRVVGKIVRHYIIHKKKKEKDDL